MDKIFHLYPKQRTPSYHLPLILLCFSFSGKFTRALQNVMTNTSVHHNAVLTIVQFVTRPSPETE